MLKVTKWKIEKEVIIYFWYCYSWHLIFFIKLWLFNFIKLCLGKVQLTITVKH